MSYIVQFASFCAVRSAVPLAPQALGPGPLIFTFYFYFSKFFGPLFGLHNTIFDPFGLLWTIFDQFGPIWTNLDKFGQIRTNLNKYGQIWTNFDKFGQIWTNLDHFGPF